MKRFVTLLLVAACAITVCAKNPTSYNYQRGIEAIGEGNYEEGEEYLLLELEENPKNGYAYAWLSSVEKNRDEIGEAISMLNKALKFLPKSDKYYNAWSYYALANIYLELNDTTVAIDYITKAIKTEPNNPKWLEQRAYIYILLDQHELALADSKKLIHKEPGHINGYILAADVYYAQKQYSEALQLYEYANNMAERSYLYSRIAKVENKLQHFEDAADHIIEAFKEEHFEDGAIDMITIENPELLEELLPRMKVQVAKNPSVIEWKFYLMGIYRHLNLYEEAIAIIKDIKTLDADPYYDYIHSDLYQDLGDWENALFFINKAYEADTTEIDYSLQKIHIYSELTRFNEAIALATQLVSQHPDNEQMLLTRADLYFDTQDYIKAADDYSTALAIRSTNHYARFKRAYAYSLNNEKTKANKDFERLLTSAEGEIEQVFAMVHLGQTEQARTKVDSILHTDTIYHTERYNIACIYSLIGETELAFKLLEEELNDGWNRFNHIRLDPDWNALRGERLDNLLQSYENKVTERVRKFNEQGTSTSSEERVVEIPFTAANGVTKVDCTINNLPLNFIFDTGASDVTISQVEANFMYKNGYLKQRDVVGKKAYQVANGSISIGTTIILKEIKFGGLVLNDVRASVVESQNAPLLLGQTVLQRLGKIEIDNTNRVLKITTNQ